ncbi:MAG: exodeoxyribonuclease III [Legionellaceae bacterium]|nr:exodeoxyribonuclease III [Legionellaceae bacterium]
MLKIASWNVNSIKMRLEQVLQWLASSETDILAIQETKSVDQLFPREAIEQAGYYVQYSGQKSYNGVAIISRFPLTEVVSDIPGWEDPQRRVLAATIQGIRLINVYVPNGALVGSDKYQYKLNWLAAITDFIQAQIKQYPDLAMVGDYNIAPDDNDVHDPQEWQGQVLVSEPERAAFQTLCALGLYDSFRQKYPQEQAFSWWDYRAAAFRRNRGLRIDHILLTAPLCQRLEEVQIDRAPRQWEKPSDHAPIWAVLQDKPL